MSNTDNFVFNGLYIIVWFIFVGLCIEAGGLITNFIFSLFKPEFLANLYNDLNLLELYHESELTFFGVYSFILTIASLKAWLFYIVIRLMHNMDIKNPFNSYSSNQIMQISHITLTIGILSFIARQLVKIITSRGFTIDNLSQIWVDSQAFILMGAIIYIIGIIYKRGVEIQIENDLTV